MYSELENWQTFSLLEAKFISQIHMVVQYGSIGSEALIVTKDGMVYALGTNINGCLGTGDTHSTLYPKKVEALCGKGIKTFAYGCGPHVLALTEKGEVYAWGHNVYCELGNGASTTNHIPIPTVVAMNLSDKFVVDVACGSHHCLALTNEGEIYTWGNNSCGQVGNSVRSDQSAPRKVNSALAGKNVVSITCGPTSSMVIVDNGEVYGWGFNGVGQLGIGNNVNQVNPTKVSALVGVVIEKLVCGFAHTLALSDEGVLYVWGGNSYGQLGLGNKSNAYSPVKLQTPEMGRVLDIAATHYNHISVVLAENNRVFVWGQCRGQSITEPTLIPLSNIYQACACFATPAVMHQPLILQSEEKMSILDYLKDAFDDPATSDLTIQVQGKPIHVHKAVLKIRCRYFRTMFQEHWSENNQSVIEHDQFSHTVYRAFLKYLYTDEVDLPSENALELLNLANVYCDNPLMRHCIQMIKQGITVANVTFLYKTAIEYNAKELEESCFKFALQHMTAVIQTPNFAELDEATIKTFIIKAAQAGVFKT